ncbi:hypothetical protein DRP53_06485 [candidate division WOR-3 bacterium]|uniref:Response regulator n=1 Tax=candidate division WOR-3 bacterium TaxID=2052148 RepID=A0A660SGM3_UNCW3|nr:MAG: hypothetical protein DRP53_06485 [candidate division WOR-3 bacterium]
MAKILIVEDDIGERELMAEAVRLDGHEPIAVSTCAEAREYLNQDIDVVLLDLVLPDTTGLDFFHEVRDLLPEAVIIVVSGKKDQEVVVETLKAGAYEFLHKPISVEELNIIIARGLRYRVWEKKGYQSMVDSIRKIVDIIELRDRYVEGHAMGVAKAAVQLATAVGLQESEVAEIRIAALLHDLGKLGIPEEILNKDGPLTEMEMAEVRKHPQLGVEIMERFLTPLMREAILYHHERWDGSGYPEGLKGESIPLPARIIAIADVYHAMQSDRPWRKKIPKSKVLKFIEKGSGILFDPELVKVFLELNR